MGRRICKISATHEVFKNFKPHLHALNVLTILRHGTDV